jgi:uncharacterized protein (DUF885 family)
MRLLSGLLAGLVALLGAAAPSNEDEVRRLADEFTYESLALDPVGATTQGYHEHHGTNLDELWDDFSTAGVERARVFFRRELDDANRLSSTQLPPELAADVDVVKLSCESELLELDRIQAYRHNPTVYVELIGNGLYSPFIFNYAPEAERLKRITARIEKIPAFLEIAKKNLLDAPKVWADVAVEENEGNLDLVDHAIRDKVPADLKSRYDRAATAAIAALKAFDRFLQRDLSRSGDWRLGPQLYAEKFRLVLATGDTPPRTLADAEAKMRSIREDMHRQALAVYPTFFPGQQPPDDLNSVVSQVLDKVAQKHATPASYFEQAKRDLADTTRFVEEHHLLALPRGFELDVIPTPMFMRGIYGVGGFSQAPALDPKLGSFYWITPFTPDMTRERVESKLREYNAWGLKILTIHEAMPGHYVQFEYSDQVQPEWRKLLRELNSNTPYVEGWAVYATEMMIEQGYDDTAEMRLTFGKQMLRVVANTILDIRLQTMGMTDQQALDLMIKDTFQEREEAVKKLQRAKLSSCQLPTYFVGWRAWDRLRDEYRKKEGASYRLDEFNERALREGPVPMPILTKLTLP